MAAQTALCPPAEPPSVGQQGREVTVNLKSALPAILCAACAARPQPLEPARATEPEIQRIELPPGTSAVSYCKTLGRVVGSSDEVPPAPDRSTEDLAMDVIRKKASQLGANTLVFEPTLNTDFVRTPGSGITSSEARIVAFALRCTPEKR